MKPSGFRQMLRGGRGHWSGFQFKSVVTAVLVAASPDELVLTCLRYGDRPAVVVYNEESGKPVSMQD
jgi:hypothetical protein